MAFLLYGAKANLGQHATDAAALTALQAYGWDSVGDGTGTPQQEMHYYNTTDNVVRTYWNGAWFPADTFHLNIPIINNIVGQTCDVDLQRGRTANLVLRLSDGNRYIGTAPLPIDLAINGLGGLEASAFPDVNDTWYYVYAVPAAAAGEFDVVASDQDPSTGPADYAAWYYIGPLRNATGVLLDQITDVHGCVSYKEAYVPAAAPSGAGAVAKASVSLADYVPPTADGVHASHWIQHDATGGFTVFGYLYVDGEANEISLLQCADVFNSNAAHIFVPIPTLNQTIEYESADDHPGDIVSDQYLRITGYRDAYLSARRTD